MRSLTDMGLRVIVAALAGGGLVALAMLGSRGLPASGMPETLGGWPLLAALAALLCGVCALGMCLGLLLSTHDAVRLVSLGASASALVWGLCLSFAALPDWWLRAQTEAPWLGGVRAIMAPVGASVVPWLLAVALLAGLLAGARHDARVTARALTPLWFTPLWGMGVSLVYGLLFASVFYAPPCPPGYHCYGLDVSRWDGLANGLALGAGAGLALGLTLALALRLALVARPLWDDLRASVPHEATAS